MQCPVCNTEADENAANCPKCEWGFKVFLGMTEEEQVQYKAELEDARKAWKAKQIDDLPQFKRGVFETRDQFKERIESQNPYSAGSATLLEKLYNVEKNIYPFSPNWEAWLKDFSPVTKGLYINAERELAKSLSTSAIEYPLGVELSLSYSYKISIKRMFLNTEKKIIHIIQNKSKKNFTSAVDDEWEYRVGLSDKVAEQHPPEDILPNFHRKIYETKEEFRKRIATEGKPYIAGTATLLKKLYDLDKKKFPVQIEWKEWPKKFPIPNKNTYIDADRDLARNLFLESKKHPVYIGIVLKNNAVIITTLDLFGINQFVPLKNKEIYKEEEEWQKACKKNTIKAYESYLTNSKLLKYANHVMKLKSLYLAEKEMKRSINYERKELLLFAILQFICILFFEGMFFCLKISPSELIISYFFGAIGAAILPFFIYSLYNMFFLIVKKEEKYIGECEHCGKVFYKSCDNCNFYWRDSGTNKHFDEIKKDINKLRYDMI